MRIRLTVVLMGLFSAALFAQSADIPLGNWTVPPYRASGITTMADATPPRAFIGVQPCRLVDTRQAGFPAGYGPPALTAGVPRNFDLNADPQCPGIPAGVDAYSLNITVTNTQGPGFILLYPQGSAQPTVSTLNYVAGQTIANAAIVPAGTDGGITVVAGVSGTQLIIDINGYFSDDWTTQSGGFYLVNNAFGTPTATFANNSTGCTGGCGVWVTIASTGAGRAITAFAGDGGVGSAGVYARQGPFFAFPGNYPGAGVRGESTLQGVVGISRLVGVAGSLVNTSGVVLAEGYLGYNVGPGYGVWSTANYGGGGAKFFVEPHPTDASKVIRYISLEGPEPGTYFRGRGKFERGMARIRVPEDFRMVTDAEGLTVQITPIGGMASVGVLRVDLNEIVVQSSRNLEFYYLVNGIRRTHKHLTTPIGEGNEYMPRSADATMPLSLTEGQRELLIQNGTYHPDGTVNMETAHRLGWDRVWAERERPAPQPAPQ
jgi:hypothetical protein